jgi:mRNA deadenylase 3'-5' endonuclease subunit Ccr4
VFRVATYNVLAAAYASRHLYSRTAAHLLDAEYRRHLLPSYLLHLDADILCLQEVEAETFAILERELPMMGYVGAFARKEKGKPDGCATFAHKDRATWIRDSHLAYDDGTANGAASGHIAQIVTVRVDERLLAVANTHLKWDPPERARESQIGLRQISELIAARSRLAADVEGWIVAGDFNVTPDSAVVTTLQSAGFEFSHVDGPAPTCVANGAARVVDYIFADSALSATALPIRPINNDSVLPAAGEASDHVPVSADFRWRSR